MAQGTTQDDRPCAAHRGSLMVTDGETPTCRACGGVVGATWCDDCCQRWVSPEDGCPDCWRPYGAGEDEGRRR
jgi:hypothetical protein